jgi:outer membrane protein assembly factor BamB
MKSIKLTTTVASATLLAGLMLAAVSAAFSSPPQAGPEQQQAQQILAATGVQGGLIVHLGCGNGKLTAALHAGDNFLVHGLDADAKNIAAARTYIRSLGTYGKVSAEQWSGQRLPYADDMVNLIVAESPGDTHASELTRVLAPLGVAYVKTSGHWTKTVKPWPPEIDEWTHYLHSADNNAVAKDRRVGPPQGVQWLEGPLWQRHHEMNANPNAMVSARGRLFYIHDEAPATVAGMPDQWVLVARDAFNGVLLWKRPIAEWGWKAWSAVETGGRFNLPVHTPRRLVAMGDRVYVTLGFNAPLTALDAATGKTLKTYEGTQSTDEILLDDGLLVLSVNETPQQPATPQKQKQLKKLAKSGQASPPSADADNGLTPAKKRVMVLKADTGEILWTQAGFKGVSSSPILGNLEHITRLLMAVGSGKVLCVEKDAIVALDLKTGRELWRTRRPELAVKAGERENSYNFSTLVVHGDVVLFQQTEETYSSSTWNHSAHCRLMGLQADTGKILWSVPSGKWGPANEGDVFVIHDLAWTHDVKERALIGVDLHSGEIKKKVPAEEVFNEVHHHRCFRNKATEQYVLTARRGIETIDLEHGQTTKNEWVRGACRYGIMPCNGLIYVPPHPCQCYIDVKLSGFYALTSMRGQGSEGGGLRADREAATNPSLQKGPAYASIANLQSPIVDPSNWPTYRHDIRRSGTTTASAPANLKRLWEVPLGTRASACTIGGGRLFAAAVDEDRVVALDANDGHLLWDYTVGGRVDTPPTIDGERVLFGSADGWVYCLRAADGALAWRFRVAPNERRMVALGRLESLWPVHGTVLVNDGVAYVAAGRSTHLDGGIRVCALKPATGELIRELHPSGQQEGLQDVLVSDGDRLHMRSLEFNLKGDDVKVARKADRKAAQETASSGPLACSTAGLLDDSCFARVGWTTGDMAGKLGKSGKIKKAHPADLLVFNAQSTFTFESRRQGGFGGWFEADANAYELAAVDQELGKTRWTTKLPVRVRGLAAADKRVFAAGPRDVVDPKDPWASVEGRAGGVLWVLGAGDGKKLAEYPLDAAPVWDGVAVANNRIFVSTLDGRVICLGEK